MSRGVNRSLQQVMRVQPGDLHLAQQVLAARGRPVAAQADRHVRRAGGVHARRVAVEQQVAQGRPHHRAAVVVHHLEVLGQQAGGVDAGEGVVDRPFVGRHLERQEMPARRRRRLAGARDALAQVQQEAAVLLAQPRQELARVPGVDVGDARVGVGQVDLPGVLDVAQDAAEEALHARIAVEHDALAGGASAQQAFALDVAHERGEQGGAARGVAVLADDRHRAADQPAIVRMRRPLAAILVQPGHRAPQRQRVVGEVVVQFDQAWEQRAPRVGDRRRLEAGRRRQRARARRHDAALGDVEDGVGQHLEGVVHRHDAPAQREPRCGQRVDRRRAAPEQRRGLQRCGRLVPRQREPGAFGRAHATIPAGTVIVMSRRLASASAPTRAAQPSCSCIHDGRPAGKSDAGIATRSPSAQALP